MSCSKEKPTVPADGVAMGERHLPASGLASNAIGFTVVPRLSLSCCTSSTLTNTHTRVLFVWALYSLFFISALYIIFHYGVLFFLY